MAHILGLTNALTDVIAKASDKDLKKLKVRKGSTTGFSRVDNSILNEILSRQTPACLQAGSTANVIFNSDKLGLETALMGTIGNDEIGKNYLKKLKKTNIFYVFNKAKGDSGRVYILATPDGERTQITDIGVAGKFSFKTNPVPFENKIFHTSGYEVASNPQRALGLIEEFTEGKKTLLSFDLACEKMIREARKPIEEVVQKTDILFATEEEAMELAGKEPYKALNELAKICQIAILKKGEKGSVVRQGSEQHKIPIYPVNVANTCGAGDAYASGFLFAYIKRFPIEECGRFGSYIASRVCANEESHL